MRLRHAFVHGLVLLAATAGATRAHADVEEARALFAEGIRLFKQGDWEGSRRLFREADAEHHAPAIVYNLALAEERLGHPQAAVDAFEAYLAEAGDGGELAIAAASAVAQIKARSTRLRVESRPPGARVFVDGSVLSEPAPATVLVPAGHHVVVAQGDGWRAEREIEVLGRGDALAVLLERPAAPAPIVPVPAPSAPPTVDRAAAPPPSSAGEAPDGLVWGAAFAAAPVYLVGITKSGGSNGRDALSVFAGPLVEVGYAITDRLEILARGLAGIGPDADPAYAFMGGPGLSYRAYGPLWLGATFIGGEFETRAHGARYGTDLVFGVMLEANVTLVKKPWGEWSAGLKPGVLLTNIQQDNTSVFFPITFGYRAY